MIFYQILFIFFFVLSLIHIIVIREGVGIPRTAYLIPGRRGMWGGRCRDFRRHFRRRRCRRFRRRRSPGVGRATPPRPTLGALGPI